MGRRPGLIVAALCLLSLLGWRNAEESLATLWVPFLTWTQALGPAAEALPGPEVASSTVEAVERAWRAGLLARPRPAPGRQLLAAPVLSVDVARREMLIAVPPDSVTVDTAVTHHGRLVGTLRSWSDGVDVVERNGRAKVALLGHPAARPVAGIWNPGENGLPLNFLVTSDARRARLTHPSRRLVAVRGERVYTRDVSSLGDHFPPGLMLGDIVPLDQDRPGGGPDGSRDDEAWLRPAIDGEDLGMVAIEVREGAVLECSTWSAERLGAASADATRLRVDRGRLDAVQPGHLVVMGHRLVGVVSAVGPLSAVVERRPPPGLLLVQDGEKLVPVAQQLSAWPDEWRPRVGQNVWVGHRELGALFVGCVRDVSDQGWQLQPAGLTRAREVTVAQP